MARRKLYIGNDIFAAFGPSPKSGMRRGREGRSEETALDNGGFWIDNSAASHATYEMEFPLGSSIGYQGIEIFDRLRSGEYGDSYIRFIDLMRAEENLLTENWAAPGLAEKGWKPIHDTTPTFSNTGANSYGKPIRKATYDVTLAANAVPVKANSVFTLLIPPTHKIVIGATGTVTGTAVLRVQPITLAGALGSVTDLTLLSDAAVPTLAASFSGATFRAVKIYITRTSAATSTITLASIIAQCLPIANSPSLARHIPGKGHTGLRFRGGSRIEEYYSANRLGKLFSGAISLAEVEQWAP